MKSKICLSFLLCLFFFGIVAEAHESLLLPQPMHVAYSDNNFKISRFQLHTPAFRNEFQDFLASCNGHIDNKALQSINVSIVDSIKGVTLNRDEAYTLSVTSKSIDISAITEKGVYWALQTLRQLAVSSSNGKYIIQGCDITDRPAFRIRGFMHDVGRSYISMDELKREIKVLSQFKINVFHFHLTENQSWRLESKIYPQLNDSANTIRMPGLYYTHQQVRELVDFCKEHNMTLIPEIDMPGHSAAFQRTFHCDMQSTEGMSILKRLVKEVCDIFDVPYLHIGTDEVQFTNPQFVPQMVDYVRSLGKKVISWNPGWNYKPGEIDMTQLWSYRGKPQPGIPAVDSKFHYLNHFDAFADIISLYNSRICNSAIGSGDIAGTILAVWNDRYIPKERNMILENNFYPNMLAIAERAWIGGGEEYFDKNGTMLPDEESNEFKSFADFERRMLHYKKTIFKELPFAYVMQTNVKWNITDAFPNGGDLAKVFPPEEGLKDKYIYNSEEYNVRKAIGAGIYLRHVWGKLVPCFYKEPKENHTAYAYTWVYSPKRQKVGLWAEFQNYSRSEKDLAPQQGKWDYKQSRIWINNKEIMPPVWTSTHKELSNEIPLGNENFSAREPIMVNLEKGWNKVFMKLPVGKFSIPQVRLLKWMFTCVFVTPDGQEAVPGLIYSPDKKKF